MRGGRGEQRTRSILLELFLLFFPLRTFARKFSNIDFFLRLLPLKVDQLVMSEM